MTEFVRRLTAKQVAERYSKPVRWVYYCNDLKPLRRKIGKYLFYLEDELEQLELRGSAKLPCKIVEIQELTGIGPKPLEEKTVTRWKFDIL